MAKIRSKAPQYLTQNQAGTYVFQARVPTFITRTNPQSKTVVRCSLKTKDYREAVRRSRAKWMLFDYAVNHYRDPFEFDHYIQQISDNCQPPIADVAPSLISFPASVSAFNRPTTSENPLLDSIVASFIQFKKDGGARAASINWYTQKSQLFAKILSVLNGRCPTIAEVTPRLIKEYTTIIQRYPRNASVTKSVRDMSDKDRIQFILNHDRDSLSAMGIPLISFNTVDHHLTAARELIRYAQQSQFPVAPNIEPLLVGRKKKRGTKPQVKFTASDLKRMFLSDAYTAGTFNREADYWLPLLALFGGQTQAELCQLHVSDIAKSDGVWFMDINDKYEKLLKTENGRPRQVPIHNTLIDLGFIRFVGKCQSSAQSRLFPNETRNANDKYPGFSKRFNRWRKQLGIQQDNNGGKKTFHSFRHTVADWLLGNGCQEGIVNDILGHESKVRSESRKTYSDGAWLQTKNEWIQQINYGIDWQKISSWDDFSAS